jgi:lipid A 4'-phosphatase
MSDPPKLAAFVSLRNVLPPWLLAAIVLMSISFVAFPQIDLACSRVFTSGGAFSTDGHWVFDAFSRLITYVGRTGGIVLTVALAIGSLPSAARTHAGRWLREQRRVIAFLLASLVIGPGLLVNYFFKDAFDRARPADVTAFGGTRAFTPAFAVSDQCDHNCSFVSGDAAGGTFVVAGFFIARSRRARKAWLVGGLAFGAAVGLARIASGHHFVSDVAVAMASTYLVLALCAVWLLRGRSYGP